ncbi:MAG: hypothetical protein EHM93_04945 [Bacteroidales bacterium]|nr:MAG: hypothetical protein EHM93_04945 [Bacteroidales bacterium]
MKNTLTLLVLSIIITSCTYKINEKTAFTPTKYNPESIRKYCDSCSESKRNMFLMIVEKITGTNDSKIIQSDSINIARNFFNINDSITLEYFEYSPNKYDKTIFFFIGNQSNQIAYLENLIALSIKSNSKIYALNYRGYGQSTGIPSFKTQFSDNQLFYNFIKPNIESKIPISMGYSLGSVFATDLALNNELSELILLAPVSNTEDMIEHYRIQSTSGLKKILRPFIRLKVDDFLMNISNVSKINAYKNKLRIFHAIDDKSLPYEMGKKLFDISNSLDKKLYTLKSGGHSAPFKAYNWEEIIMTIK